nr:uncharacterized protein LOC103349017 [Oryctolagus cuniculus]XP_051706052.1 uncharacterized protein LOC103349017 [Oryctolagus cuniculus]
MVLFLSLQPISCVLPSPPFPSPFLPSHLLSFPFLSFPCCIVLARTSKVILKRTDKRGHLYLSPYLLHILLVCPNFFFFKKRNIYLFESQSYRERERIFHSLVHSPNGCNVGLGQAIARSQELLLGLLCGHRGPRTWASSAAFPVTLAGSWIRAELPGLELVPIQDASTAGEGLTCCTTVPTPVLTFLKIYLFYLKGRIKEKQRQRQRERERSSIRVHSPDGYNIRSCIDLKPGNWELLPGLPCGCRGPRTFPGHSRELDQKCPYGMPALQAMALSAMPQHRLLVLTFQSRLQISDDEVWKTDKERVRTKRHCGRMERTVNGPVLWCCR